MASLTVSALAVVLIASQQPLAPWLAPALDESSGFSLIWGDIDRDGRDDALVIGPQGGLQLFANRGEGRLEDVTARSGLDLAEFASCALFADFDGDGLRDLFLGSAEQRLWRNLGEGAFQPFESELEHDLVDLEAVALDHDADGQLDLHLHTEAGDVFYRNLGRGRFERVVLPGADHAAPLELAASDSDDADSASSGAGASPARRRYQRWLRERARRTSSSAGGGAPSSLAAGPVMSGTNLGNLPLAGLPSMICAGTIVDQATTQCIEASSFPTLGELYPLTQFLNVASGTRFVGVNTTAPAYRLHVVDDIGPGMFSEGWDWGARGKANSTSGAGIYGEGPTTGVRGDAFSAGPGNRIGGEFTASGGSNNIGVRGTSTIGVHGIGTAYGTFGETNTALSTGVFGRANHPSAATTGVLGEVASTSGTAVLGQASASTGATIGVRGTTASSSGFGVRGEGPVTGVRGDANGTGGSGDRFGGHFTASGGSNNVGVYSFSTTGVQGVGTAYGVRGSASSVGGIGLAGDATAVSGASIGVRGTTTSASGAGVVGANSSSGADAVGVLGAAGALAVGANAAGVRGVIVNPAGTSEGVGVEGTHSATGVGVRGTTAGGTGVVGSATASSGSAIGVHGSTAASDGVGVRGEVTHSGASGFAYGVEGIAPVRAIYGRATSTTSSSSTGVTGITSSSNGTGVFGGYTGSVGAYGVRGVGRTGVEGVHVGLSGSEPGVRGATASTDVEAVGVLGVLTAATVGVAAAGVLGHNPSTGASGYGVYGRHDGAGVAVRGRCDGDGTGGDFNGAVGVRGSGSSFAPGGVGIGGTFRGSLSDTNVGVEAVASASSGSCTGIDARAIGGFSCVGGSFETSGNPAFETAVYGENQSPSTPGNHAGYFVGNLHVSGTVNANVKAFKIDHPLDPENQYLWHSSVESSEMKNIYDGIATLDSSGSAWVQLPAWFETLNGDFRYQLTCIGPWAPVSIGQRISDNRFQIIGGSAGQEVSWQVTGVRRDPSARAHRLPVEEPKLEHERGYYLDPQAYGLPRARGVQVAFKKLMRGEFPGAADEIRSVRQGPHSAARSEPRLDAKGDDR